MIVNLAVGCSAFDSTLKNVEDMVSRKQKAKNEQAELLRSYACRSTSRPCSKPGGEPFKLSVCNAARSTRA